MKHSHLLFYKDIRDKYPPGRKNEAIALKFDGNVDQIGPGTPQQRS